MLLSQAAGNRSKLFDLHVHVPDDQMYSVMGNHIVEASAAYFRAKVVKQALSQVEDELRAAGVTGYALLPVPRSGFDANRANEISAKYLAQSEMAVGFAAVNPDRDPSATMRKALDDQLEGLKIHPTLQECYPSDERLQPVYELLSDSRGVVVVHTGTSGIGGGLKGGGGMKIEYSRPIYIDEVAAKFPEVKFVMAHFGWPWTEEAIAISLQKANVYLDLSGWSPKYIPQELWKYANSLLQDKILFGSDYPFVNPLRWKSEFDMIELKPEVKEKILYKNAARLFDLA